MKIEKLFSIIFENNILKPSFKSEIQGDDGVVYQTGRREKLHSNEINHIEPIQNTIQVKNRIVDLVQKHGFIAKNLKELERKLNAEYSSVLFRGHKTLNPFLKTSDSKLEGDVVYWAKQPHNALTFAVPTSVGGTSGRFFSNSINKAFGAEHAGYVSIAIPKNTDDIVWRGNFGIENQSSIQTQQTGYKQSEVALGPNDIKKIRTYIAIRFGSRTGSKEIQDTDSLYLLNVEVVKRKDKPLFELLSSDRI